MNPEQPERNAEKIPQFSEADLQNLVTELETVMLDMISYHDRMKLMWNYYKYSAFNSIQAGQMPLAQRNRNNFLKVFARKNILYTSGFPRINVPTPGPEEAQRKSAANREKLLYSVWRKSGGSMLQRKVAFDGTVRSVALFLTEFDIKNRCARVRRMKPTQCFWQFADDDENRLHAFWQVTAISKKAAWQKYGVVPTTDLLPRSVTIKEKHLNRIDGQEWFTNILRVDGTSRTRIIGNKIAEMPHNHLMGDMPVDLVMPFNDDERDGSEGAFYIEDLIEPQASLNDVTFRRLQVMKRNSNPTTWARGIMQGKAFDDFQANLKSGNGGGVLSLAKDGDVGILQLNDTSLLDNIKKDILEDMQRIAGFSAATFGESVGANTSGDALGMYFTPTQKLIDDENVSWVAAYESINSKILRAYDNFLKPGEKIFVEGYAPRGTMLPVVDQPGVMQYSRGGFRQEISKEDIAGQYTSVVTMPNVTPKNEIEEKRFWKEAVDAKFVSRTTGYEQIGLESPEEELELLNAEQANPLINPDGTQKILENAFPPKTPTSAPVEAM